jgi:hypothetical protein
VAEWLRNGLQSWEVVTRRLPAHHGIPDFRPFRGPRQGGPTRRIPPFHAHSRTNSRTNLCWCAEDIEGGLGHGPPDPSPSAQPRPGTAAMSPPWNERGGPMGKRRFT